MKTNKKIFNKFLLSTFLILLVISYAPFSYADSNKYLSRWYEYKLQTAKPESIDSSTIDEIADNLANNKKPIYSLIVDNNSLSPNTDILEKLLNAVRTNTTIKDLSFFNFNGQDIEKIAKVLNSKVFSYNEYRSNYDWLISVDFTNNTDVIISESAAKEISSLIKKGLINLDLSGNKIGTDELSIIVRELPNSKLQHLALNKIKISQGGIDTLANALRKGNNELTFLSLNQNNIDTDSATQLIEAMSADLLKNISLANNNIGNDEKFWQLLGRRLNNTYTYHINFAENNINSTGIINFINIINRNYYPNPDLVINFAKNKIDSKGAIAIANSQTWLRLTTTINLEGNNIGLDGAMALINTANTKEKLEKLNLMATDIENTVTLTHEHSDL